MTSRTARNRKLVAKLVKSIDNREMIAYNKTSEKNNNTAFQ